ncbi:MAG: NUDIX hydrolase [Ectobacillus sp.]
MGYIAELRACLGTRPLIIASSAIIVLNDNQEVLLQLCPDTNNWKVPIGAMEPGEAIDETAMRKLLEETGLHSEAFQFLGVLSGKELYYKYAHGDEVYYVIHIFQADCVQGNLQPSGKGVNLRYFSVEKLPKLHVITEKILKKFLAALTE